MSKTYSHIHYDQRNLIPKANDSYEPYVFNGGKKDSISFIILADIFFSYMAYKYIRKIITAPFTYNSKLIVLLIWKLVELVHRIKLNQALVPG